MRSIDRYGRFVLLAVFVVLLGGRFTLDRLGDLPAWDLRWFGVAAIGLLVLAWATAARERTVPAVRLWALCLALALWAGWLVASSLWAPPGSRLGAYVSDLVLLLMLVVTGWAVANRIHPAVMRSLWWWLYIAGLLYAAAAAVGGPDVQGRYSALGGGPNVFVRIMALATVAALFLALTQDRYWSLAGLPVFLAGAFLSGSRGGVLALVVIAVVGTVPLWRRMGSKLRMSLVSAALPVAGLAPFVIDPLWFDGLRERFIQQTLVDQYDSGRSEILEGAWRLFVEAPVAGVGVDGYYALIGNRVGWEYPHNLVIATAAEGGLLGLLPLTGALVVTSTVLRAGRPLPADALGFALCGLFMLVASMFSGDYYDSRFMWFFLGLALISNRRDAATVPATRSEAHRGVSRWRLHGDGAGGSRLRRKCRCGLQFLYDTTSLSGPTRSSASLAVAHSGGR